MIYQAVDSDANIIFGANIDESVTSGDLSITVLATGFNTDFHTDGLTPTPTDTSPIGPRKWRSPLARLAASANTVDTASPSSELGDGTNASPSLSPLDGDSEDFATLRKAGKSIAGKSLSLSDEDYEGETDSVEDEGPPKKRGLLGFFSRVFRR